MSPPTFAISHARAAALKSPCAKSNRGAVIFDRANIDYWQARGITPYDAIVGEGHNGQPVGFTCSNSVRCRRDCARLCMHAEQRAVMQALVHSGDREHGCAMEDLEVVHVKVSNGEVVPGKGPCCEQCSRMILDAGMRGIWLLEETDQPGGEWRFYDAKTFHEVTLRALELGGR